MNGHSQTPPRMYSEALSAEHARQLLADGGQLVDVRPSADYYQDTLPGAMNLPLGTLSYESGRLDKHSPVILYCRSDALSRRAARLLAGRGFSRIYRLES